MNSSFRNAPGKAELLEQLYTQYGRLMYHVAYEILRDPYLAEDAVQSAFLKLTKNTFSIDSVSCNKTRYFMVIIVRNISIEIYHAKKKNALLFEEEELSAIPDDAQSPLDNILHDEGIETIQRMLRAMDTKYSDMIMMRYFYDYSLSEIAALFNISEQLVRVRLHRARKMLVEKLIEEQSHEKI